jgi:hypothetical protein
VDENYNVDEANEAMKSAQKEQVSVIAHFVFFVLAPWRPTQETDLTETLVCEVMWPRNTCHMYNIKHQLPNHLLFLYFMHN